VAVIGRLDEQVDAVLIRPLSKKRRPEPEQPEPTPEGRAAERPAATDDATNVESGPERETLPVWML
jgi:hypothetical protein